MTDDRLSGSAKHISGQVEEGFGRVTGDEKNAAPGQGQAGGGDAARRLRPGEGNYGRCC